MHSLQYRLPLPWSTEFPHSWCNIWRINSEFTQGKLVITETKVRSSSILYIEQQIQHTKQSCVKNKNKIDEKKLLSHQNEYKIWQLRVNHCKTETPLWWRYNMCMNVVCDVFFIFGMNYAFQLTISLILLGLVWTLIVPSLTFDCQLTKNTCGTFCNLLETPGCVLMFPPACNREERQA